MLTYVCIRPGSHSESCGTKVTTNKPITVTNINGIVAGMTLCIGRFPICAAIYMFIPSGGVTMPIDVAVTIMAPKCTRDTPYCSAMGAKIGARTITAGDASTKQPVISMMITTQIRNTILLLLKLSIALAAMLATCSRAEHK